jgi:hypothetical protein
MEKRLSLQYTAQSIYFTKALQQLTNQENGDSSIFKEMKLFLANFQNFEMDLKMEALLFVYQTNGMSSIQMTH